MDHLNYLAGSNIDLPKSFIEKATGKFYTHEFVADHMISTALQRFSTEKCNRKRLSIIDPFAGDGRLIIKFIEAWLDTNRPDVIWEAVFWDLNPEGLEKAQKSIASLIEKRKVRINPEFLVGDSFRLENNCKRKFDIVISNPPWELLKPDHRELKHLRDDVKLSYVSSMRNYDQFLEKNFPVSQPSQKFAGWGTNLSRVGYDVCQKLNCSGGIIAIVMPSSFMADSVSGELRKQIFTNSTLHEVAYFPAEAKLFGSVDVASITLVVETKKIKDICPKIIRYNRDRAVISEDDLQLSGNFLETSGYSIPVSIGGKAMSVLERLSIDHPSWKDLEGDGPMSLWAGRELDETGSGGWLKDVGCGPLFVKGRMIDRFKICETPSLHVEKKQWNPTQSMNFNRIIWRDVSRPSQKRRMIATIIPKGPIAGNSLGVAYFRDNNSLTLLTLLGIMSSIVFEFQLRCYLSTGHVSLSSLRKVRVPNRFKLDLLPEIATEVETLIENPQLKQFQLEALVAKKAYGLSCEEFRIVVEAFPQLTDDEKYKILEAFDLLNDQIKMQKITAKPCHTQALQIERPLALKNKIVKIPNHFTARLSALDLRMVRSIPQGGNWKNIPETIPSKRLEQIRDSYKRGEGSRSTYYGRLKPEMPSYTINTYFNRPGNGCHIHYEQDRVISHREAARLQSFPDSFKFEGPQGIVNKQIGNAVPPLLAYQIALQLGKPGCFVDLFSGAGGMGLGFMWAGWTPLVANDIERRFLQTYSNNVHSNVILGSITEEDIRKNIEKRVKEAKSLVGKKKPFWVLGGPPCQGFSNAGTRRTMDDSRNQLFRDYIKVLSDLQPDGFVFENVTGLLNMQKGSVFKMVKDAFQTVMPRVDGWLLSSDEYAIPQRRKRVILVGNQNKNRQIIQPCKITNCDAERRLVEGLEPAISVEEALSDLPSLQPSQDGSMLNYKLPATNAYQAFVRGQLSPGDYLKAIRDKERIKS